MAVYQPSATAERFSIHHPWLQLLSRIELYLQLYTGEDFVARSSMGQGRWALVPWVALSHVSESFQMGLLVQVIVP